MYFSTDSETTCGYSRSGHSLPLLWILEAARLEQLRISSGDAVDHLMARVPSLVSGSGSTLHMTAAVDTGVCEQNTPFT